MQEFRHGGYLVPEEIRVRARLWRFPNFVAGDLVRRASSRDIR